MDLPQVIHFLSAAQSAGKRIVLVTVCGVEGSSMRNPGTIMGVAEDSTFAGSLSGGCIENAVVSEGLEVLREGAPRLVRFGAGSPYLDIKLPCGGGLDVSFHEIGDEGFVPACQASIEARAPFSIATGISGPSHIPEWREASFDPAINAATFGHYPGPHLQIIGHGATVELLASMAQTFGCSANVLTPDTRLIEQLAARGVPAEQLDRTNQTDLLKSDPWTATVFLFHDHDWEIDIMERALSMPHFYLGAMGGRRAHAFRSEALTARGITADQLDTINAPIGLFHSSRDPHTLALSTLGEVIRTYEESIMGRRIGVALLAAGASRRFGDADKLCAQFRGRALGEHAADAIPMDLIERAWVIASAPDHPCELYWRARRFDPLVNPRAGEGMGTSVALAAEAAKEAEMDGLLIALADMPLVPASHFKALIDEWDASEPITVSAIGDTRMPPALFGSKLFKDLAQSSGDQGARVLIGQGLVVPCQPEWLADIDTPEALAKLS